jgi:hypothetical protein
MSANDSLLFIDANKYLDLYRMDKGKDLLVLLEEQAEYIFVTEQVVNEVQRNKLEVAAEFLKQNFKDFKDFRNLDSRLPDYLSSMSLNQRNEILQEVKAINKKISKVKTKLNTLVPTIIQTTMEQIACSKDEISRGLVPVFTKIVSHCPEELERARNRKELGNPPGKKNDPIGDQLTWEQILTHFKGKKRLWIISRDIDYGTSYGDKRFLNCFLYNELSNIVSEPEVYLFDNIVEGIHHFVKITGVKAEKGLTPKEVEEIENEEKSLPDITQLSGSLHEILEAFRVLKPLSEIAKDIGPFDPDAWRRDIEPYRRGFLSSSQEGDSEEKEEGDSEENEDDEK